MRFTSVLFKGQLCFCGITVMSLFSLLFLFIEFPLFLNLHKGLSGVFNCFEKQLLSLIFSIMSLVSVSCTSVVFVTSFLLLTLGLVYSFSSPLTCKARLFSEDLSFFLSLGVDHYKLPSWNCFCSTL